LAAASSDFHPRGNGGGNGHQRDRREDGGVDDQRVHNRQAPSAGVCGDRPADGLCVHVCGGTVVAIGGLVFSIYLLATRNSTELWMLFAIVSVGVLIRGFKSTTVERRL
jgi:hypothetical protein